MKTHDGVPLGGWVRRFLIEHLVVERNLSRNTQRSYRGTLRLLIPFAADHHKAAVDRLGVTEVSADVVRGFPRHVKERRGCGVRTRNQRLAAIHALATFVGERCPELIPWCGEVRAVPFKRYDRPSLCYLDKPEIDALLAAPDRGTEQGRRDHRVLLFLYNTGARASEAAALATRDLDVRSDGSGSVRLIGKGGKTRHCPLWPTTLRALRALASGRSPDEPVFRNRRLAPSRGLSSTRPSHGTRPILSLPGSVRNPSTWQPDGPLLNPRGIPKVKESDATQELASEHVDVNRVVTWLRGLLLFLALALRTAVLFRQILLRILQFLLRLMILRLMFSLLSLGRLVLFLGSLR
jgi:site-specific recombinase XerD